MQMSIEKNSRQMPATSAIVKEKDYCDLLYAWLQCNSERANMNSNIRKIAKSKIKWTAIEKDFTRIGSDGSESKIMTRKTIAKYFNHLVEKGLVQEDGDDYCLTVLEPEEANLIEYKTLSKLMNVLQKNSISIYIYLFNRFYANGREPFMATVRQIKEFIGIAVTTTSNNVAVDDTLDILRRLGLLSYSLEMENDGRSYYKFGWVRNCLPEI